MTPEKTADIKEIVMAFKGYIQPGDGLGSDNPFTLVCSLTGPASLNEIAKAWPDRELPSELLELWMTSRQTFLFRDADYGQWGLRLLPPVDSANRTREFIEQRPQDALPGDMVMGEFLGDSELLVLTEKDNRVLVALPLDHRADWYQADSSLADFLIHYRAALGQKYWER